MKIAVIVISVLLVCMILDSVISYFKMVRLVEALRETNKRLNESRELVAQHQRQIKAIEKHLS